EGMGQVYRFLGLEVGCIVHGLTDDERRPAYAGDVTYGTNNGVRFDYLPHNMKDSVEAIGQRRAKCAIGGEVDSIRVDEARTPLIISGPTEDHSNLYITIDALIPKLEKVHFELDEKARQVHLTEEGNEFMEDLLRQNELLNGGTLYDVENVS